MARKIVAVPFVYEADVRPPRARNTRTVRIRDEIGVVVRDLAPEDFPVALRAAEAGNTHYGQVDDIRWDGLSLYVPHVYETVHSREHLDAGCLDQLAAPDVHSPFSGALCPGHFGPPAVRLAEVHGAIVSDTREAGQCASPPSPHGR